MATGTFELIVGRALQGYFYFRVKFKFLGLLAGLPTKECVEQRIGKNVFNFEGDFTILFKWIFCPLQKYA